MSRGAAPDFAQLDSDQRALALEYAILQMAELVSTADRKLVNAKPDQVDAMVRVSQRRRMALRRLVVALRRSAATSMGW